MKLITLKYRFILSDYAFRNCIKKFRDYLNFEEVNIERPQMVAKLIVNLEQGMQKGLLNNQSSGVAACAKQIISLVGLASDSSYNNRVKQI